MRRVNCPLCGADEAEVIARRAGAWNFRARNVICRRCGMIYRNPQWDEEEAARFYRRVSRYYALVYGARRLEEGNIRERHRAERRVAWVERYLQPPARILDVGAGSGAFVELAGQRGFEAMGVELDEEAVQAARERGVELVAVDFCDQSWQPGRFDAVTMFHVLEHALDLDEFLKRAAELLEEGGLLFVEVPDTERVRFRFKDYLVPEHCWHFTGRTLGRLLESRGWEVVELESRDEKEEYANMLFAVARRPERITDVARAGEDREHYEYMRRRIEEMERQGRRSLGIYARDVLTQVLGPWVGMEVFRVLLAAKRALFGGRDA